MGIITMRHAGNTNGLFELINILPDNLIMAEIGCYAGESTRMFMESKKVNTMYAIDIWTDELNIYNSIIQNHNFSLVEKAFDENTKEFNVVKLKMNLEQALDKLPELDIVYIDGNHNYEYVKKDIEMSLKKVKKNGIISGHDYHNDTPDVIKAVNEFFNKPDIVFSDASWIVYLK